MSVVFINAICGQHLAFQVRKNRINNVAPRMESTGEIGQTNITAYTHDLIHEEFDCEYRSKLDAKNKGRSTCILSRLDASPSTRTLVR